MTFALALAAALLLDADVPVAHNRTREMKIPLKDKPAVLLCDYYVKRGNSQIQALLVERLSDRDRPLAVTEEAAAGKLRYQLNRPGNYWLRFEGTVVGEKPADVRIRVELDEDSAGSFTPRTLDRAARWRVVAISLVSFLALAAWSGTKLWRATRRPVD